MQLKIDPKFVKGDYIISRDGSGDLAIVKGISNKNYYQFKEYYDSMLGEFKDLKNSNYELQVNYQKFWDICTQDEHDRFDKLLKEKGGN